MGFLFIILGIILLWITSASPEGGVFFIFPFFFFEGSNVLSFAVVIMLAFVFLIIVLRWSSMAILRADYQSPSIVQDNFIPIGSRCVYCSKPIPINSSFCPFCGSPVEKNEG
jgi:hypothetical protein